MKCINLRKPEKIVLIKVKYIAFSTKIYMNNKEMKRT